jgi:hypothetical protein
MAILTTVVFLPTRVLLAQAVTGTLLGTVQDQTGAVVPSATVTLTNEGTNVSDKATTTVQGFYTFPNLNPGLYAVTVEASGFKKVLSQHNSVEVQKTTRVELSLQPGGAETEVTVTGQAPLVESTTSDLGQTIDEHQISTLPVNGRLFSSLMQIAPGTTPAAWGDQVENPAAAGSTAPGGGGGGTMTSVNGFPFQANLYIVDGVKDQELVNAYVAISIPFTEISEMKIETNSPTAEYGTFGGAVVNITTKTGANAFHGSLFEYNRNTVYNASYHFSKVNPPFHANQFGAALSGPIIKNKLFFSADFQELREAQSSAGVWSLPTAAARAGDLSAFVSGGAGPITNPHACYLSALANHLPNPQDCTASPGVTVAGTADTVPASDIVPIAANFFNPKIMPLPNRSGATNNYSYTQPTIAVMPQFDARVDYPLSDKDRFFARVSYLHRDYNQPGPGTNYMNNGNGNGTNANHNDVFGWDHVFSPNLVNQFRIGFSRYLTNAFTAAYGTDANNQLGLPNGNVLPTQSGIAQMNWGSQWAGTGDPGWLPNGLGRLSNEYQFVDSLTLIRGGHTFKYGFNFNALQARVKNAQNDPRGQMHISGTYTGTGTPGAELADWLTGALSEVDRDEFFSTPNTRAKFIGGFAQDDYRVNSKLTLNLGLRYDVYTKPVDTNNLQGNFVTSGANAGAIQIASSNNRGPNIDTYKLNMAPRLGFAYTPDGGKTALRGAFGMSYFNDNFGAMGGTLERNYPYLQQSNNSAPQQNCNSTVTATSVYSGCGSLILANGLPGITAGTPGVTPGVYYQPLIRPTPAAGSFVVPPSGFGVYQVSNNFRQDEAKFWNVSVQRQLTSSISFQAAYVGTVGSNLFHDYQLNQCVPPTYGAAVTSLTALVAQTGASSIPQACYLAGYGFKYYNIAPNVSTIDLRDSAGKSHYNSGQFQVTKRTTKGLAFTTAYTWSKMMDNINNPITNYSTRQEVDTANWQRNNYPQVLTFTYTYDLPIGRNREFLASSSRVVDALIGGWQVSGITNFRSGAPLLISAPNGDLGPRASSQRANYNCVNPVNPRTVDRYFDTSCFTAPIGFTLGNSGIGKVYGPRYQNWDMSLNKAVQFTERVQLQLQASFFNIFNHTNFNTPDTSVQDGNNFGRVSSEFVPRQGQLGLVLSF